MKLRNLALAAGAAAGWSLWLASRGSKLEFTLPAEQIQWRWGDFDINLAVAGQGRPLVLLHAVYPGASSAQWEHNFAFLAKRFRVYAPDLPGFGLSSRPALDYSPLLYEEMVEAFLREVVEEPAVVVASGQSAAFAIDVAADSPGLVSHLVLDTPTGLSRFSGRAPMGQELMYRFWSLPVLGDLAYLALTSSAAIRTRVATEALVDEGRIMNEVIDETYKQTHQPGAKWAPIAMLGGRLNTDIRDAYSELNQPILLVWGNTPSYIPIDDVDDFLSLNDNAQLRTFSHCRMMPEYEHSSRFNLLLEEWIATYREAA